MKFSPLIFRVIISVIFFPCLIKGQDTIYLNNPSFEDIPRAATGITPPIKGWLDCGRSKFVSESPPDIQPGFWSVKTKAFDGETYLGMVVRDNDSWESVSQPSIPGIKADHCYSFHAHLSISPKYESRTKKSPDNLVNFSNPVVLQIWGGTYSCEKKELLAKSEPISDLDWKEYVFEFFPITNHSYITLEVFYKLPILESYNGHLLIDNLSPIIEISCE